MIASKKLGEDIPGYLMADSRLHMNEEALERVVARLKNLLVEMIENKRASRLASRKRPKTSTVTCRSGSRSQSGRVQRVVQDINLSVSDKNDSFVNTSTLTRKAICSPAQFLLNEKAGEGYLTRPRTTGYARSTNRGTMYGVSDARSVSPNILNRLSLKVHAYDLTRHDRLSGKSEISESNGGTRSKSGDSSEAPKLELPVLKEKIHEFRVLEAQILKKSKTYAPKQLLSEFSTYGTRVNRNWRPLSSDPLHDPCRDLISLIDTLDQRLSTNEALAIFKELGIDYQPRSASGKKNMMASDLSFALASSGLKLTDGASVSKEDGDKDGSSVMILTESNRYSSSSMDSA